MLLHLKRFELDMTTMSRVKLNDRLTFPAFINMNPGVYPLVIEHASRVWCVMGRSVRIAAVAPTAPADLASAVDAHRAAAVRAAAAGAPRACAC